MSERSGVRDLLDADEVREVLSGTFYRESPSRKTRRGETPKPEHYEVICISLYKEDLERLDEKVKVLKARGHRKMSRSALIRYALDHADLERLPRAY
jgi:hypothetical protein